MIEATQSDREAAAYRAGYLKAMSLARIMVPTEDVDRDWREYARDHLTRHAAYRVQIEQSISCLCGAPIDYIGCEPRETVLCGKCGRGNVVPEKQGGRVGEGAAKDEDVRAVRQSLDNAYAQLAAEAIRSSFFVSVSGEDKPYRYHLRLSYPTMEAMHTAEDHLKQFAARATQEPQP